MYTFWHKCFWDTYFEQSRWIHINCLTSICKVFNLFQFLFKNKPQVFFFWEKIALVSSSIKTCQIKWVLRKCRIISFKSYKNLPTSKDMYSEKKRERSDWPFKSFLLLLFCCIHVRQHKCTPLNADFQDSFLRNSEKISSCMYYNKNEKKKIWLTIPKFSFIGSFLAVFMRDDKNALH